MKINHSWIKSAEFKAKSNVLKALHCKDILYEWVSTLNGLWKMHVTPFPRTRKTVHRNEESKLCKCSQITGQIGIHVHTKKTVVTKCTFHLVFSKHACYYTSCWVYGSLKIWCTNTEKNILNILELRRKTANTNRLLRYL